MPKHLLPPINFASLGLALLLFLLPWTSVKCDDKEMATQSGLQAIYGGVSLDDDFEDVAKDRPTGAEAGDDNDVPFGFIALLVFLLVLGGTVAAGLTLFKSPFASMLPISPSLFAAAALVLLLFQSLIGFPIDRKVDEAPEPPRSEMPDMTAAERAQMPPELARLAQAQMDVDTDRTFWFYLELLALLVPTGLMVLAMPSVQAKLNQARGPAGAFPADSSLPSTSTPAPPPQHLPPTPPAASP